jgi:hypothetical protein
MWLALLKISQNKVTSISCKLCRRENDVLHKWLAASDQSLVAKNILPGKIVGMLPTWDK